MLELFSALLSLVNSYDDAIAIGQQFPFPHWAWKNDSPFDATIWMINNKKRMRKMCFLANRSSCVLFETSLKLDKDNDDDEFKFLFIRINW